MTTLVAYVHRESGRTWVGADGRVSGGEVIIPADARKFRKLGKWWFGLAGNPVALDIIEQEARADIERCGANAYKIVKSIWSAWSKAGFKPGEESGPTRYGQFLLMVRPGVIISVSDGSSMAPIIDPFFAEGSGAQFALGAMAAIEPTYRGHGLDGDKLLEHALEIAARYDSATGSPFTVVEVTE